MRVPVLMGALAVSVGMAGALAAQPREDTDVDIQTEDTRVETEVERQQPPDQRTERQQPAERTQQAAQKRHSVKRVSELMDVEIQNPRGEDIGDVEDIVLHVESGQIRYVAVAFGGFAGIGEDLFAVPWEAFQATEQDGEYMLVLDVTEQQLENAQGFDENNWPDMADPQWREQNDRVYETTIRRQNERQTEPRATELERNRR